MAYIDRTQTILALRWQQCADCPGIKNSDYSDCKVCGIQHCIDAIKLMPAEDVRPIDDKLVERHTDEAEPTPQAYFDALEEYGKARPSRKPWLLHMRFVHYEAGLLTVEFSAEHILAMKVLERDQTGLQDAFSRAFGTYVGLHMRLEGEKTVLEPCIAHRIWDFAKYGTTYVCSECHSPVLHKDQSYCAFCGRKMSKEVEEF